MLAWSEMDRESWASSLRLAAEMLSKAAPPNGWAFPAMTLACQDGSTFDARRYLVARADARGLAKAKSAEVVAAFYLCIHVCCYMCIYIYIHRERER